MLEHNKIVYDEVIERLKTSSRVCIVQATGTGKGVIASSLIEDYVNVLVIAPTNAILENYRMNLGVNSENVIFYTYQGISMLLNNQIEELGEKVSLIILDEFHRIGAETWGRKVEMLCDRAEAKGCKTVGLSATPVRYLDNERDMSEEFFKGNVVNGLNIVDAVISGVLPTFKYVVSYYGYEKDLFKKLEERKEKVSNEIKQIVSNLENNYSIGKIIQNETKELGKNQKWVMFFRKIEELEEFKDKIYSWFDGKVNIFILHSHSNYSGNMKVLKEFNNSDKDINVLLSVNMLNEGVHIKDIDGIIMLRKTMSPIVYLQQLGRALQVGGKNPIIFDFIGNYRRLIEYKEHSEVLKFIDEINTALNNEMSENKSNEKKIIVHSYAEEMYEIIETIHTALYLKTHDFWSKEDMDILLKYYTIGGYKLCQEMGLSRDKKSILSKASNLKLKYKILPPNWTIEEDNILRTYYIDGGVKGVIEKGLQNRKESEILKRAKQLGLRYLNKADRSPAWTEEELDILYKYYNDGGSKLCISHGLKRNRKQISGKAYLLGLIHKDVRVLWTKEEEDIIKQYYPQGGIDLCIEKGLKNRTSESIRVKANKLGFTSVNYWTDEEISILNEYYPQGGTDLCIKKGIINRSTLSIMDKANSLGLYTKFVVSSNDWSTEEENILRKYYLDGGAELCQEKGVLRSISAIKHRASKLGLVFKSSWTQSEIDILTNYYILGGYELCVEKGLTNRTKKSVRQKVSELQLVETSRWSIEEINILKEYYHIEGKKVLKRLPNRKWDGTRKKAKALGLHFDNYVPHNYWTIEEDDILYKYYSIESSKIVNRLPNRSLYSIRKRAEKLGLKVEHPIRSL